MIDYPELSRVNQRGIHFVTIRRRGPAILRRLARLPATQWTKAVIDTPKRSHQQIRWLASRLQGFENAAPKQLYRRFVETSGRGEIQEKRVVVHFDKRSHNPILREAGLDREQNPIPGSTTCRSRWRLPDPLVRRRIVDCFPSAEIGVEEVDRREGSLGYLGRLYRVCRSLRFVKVCRLGGRYQLCRFLQIKARAAFGRGAGAAPAPRRERQTPQERNAGPMSRRLSILWGALAGVLAVAAGCSPQQPFRF